MNDMPPLDQEELMRRITRDLADSYDEELEMEIEDRHPLPDTPAQNGEAEKDYRAHYFSQLFRLQSELVKLQDWVVESHQKVVILFEGRDAAGLASPGRRRPWREKRRGTCSRHQGRCRPTISRRGHRRSRQRLRKLHNEPEA